MVDATRELIVDAAAAMRRLQAAVAGRTRRRRSPRLPVRLARAARACSATRPTASPTRSPSRCWRICVDGSADRDRDQPARACWRPMSSALIQEKKFSIVCIADLPPSASSKTRYLVKRLRAAFPDLRIIVGRWAPPALADESAQVLRDAGAKHVASTLVETRDYLATLVDVWHPRGTSTPPERRLPADLSAMLRAPVLHCGAEP